MDIRSADFTFADALAGAGGLALCASADMPRYSQEQIAAYMRSGRATAGGPGNTAPLLSRAGLKVAAGVVLGAGECGGFDVQGKMFHDIMTRNGVDMSSTKIHPTLPTGTTFIHECPDGERGGIAYFPNANNEFDFDVFKPEVARLEPAIGYYMYSGLSERGDANGGRDLADFMRWCRARGALTVADSHTLAGNPRETIANGTPVSAYRLLEPLLPELDIFFTSADEAKMILNTLDEKRETARNCIPAFLEFLRKRFMRGDRPQMFGVTVKNGAHVCYGDSGIFFAESEFMDGKVVDLVGAGDSFRAGVAGYVSQNINAFRNGTLNAAKAAQTGNRMASLFVTAPLGDRYAFIPPINELTNF